MGRPAQNRRDGQDFLFGLLFLPWFLPKYRDMMLGSCIVTLRKTIPVRRLPELLRRATDES